MISVTKIVIKIYTNTLKVCLCKEIEYAITQKVALEQKYIYISNIRYYIYIFI